MANTNVPDAMLVAGELYAFAKDARGSVRQVIDLANGTVVQSLTYDEFGRVLEDTNPGFQPFGFAGGLYDADTQLVRFGARDYDAEVGRWTSKDPIRWAGGQGNLYVYVGNDPVGFTDPSGLVAPWIAAGGVGAAINTTGYLIASDERTLRGTLSAAAGGFVTGAVSLTPFGGATFAGGLAGSLTESALAGTQLDPVEALWSGVSNFVGGSAGARLAAEPARWSRRLAEDSLFSGEVRRQSAEAARKALGRSGLGELAVNLTTRWWLDSCP